MKKPVQLQFKADTCGIEFRNAKFDFFAFGGRYIKDCSFYQCEMQSAFAANSRILTSDFIQSDLRFSDFRNVRMQQVRILDCDVYGADFRNCQMQDCHIDGVDFTNANTEGMIIGGKIFDDKVKVGSKWIEKSYPRSKGLYLVVEQVNGNEVAYSDATTNLRYAYISKAELLRDYDHLTQSDIDAM